MEIIQLKKILFLGITLIFFNCSITRAQHVVNEADKQFELFNYAKAIDLYKQEWKKKETIYTAEHLGACYWNQRNYHEAENWYAIASAMPDSSPKNTLNLANALRSNSKFEEAKIQYEKYITLDQTVSVSQRNLWLLSCDSAMNWMRKPMPIIINNERVLNSPQSDWGVAKLGKEITFSSDKGTVAAPQNGTRPFLKFDGANVPDKNIYGWTGNHYLHLYQKSETNEVKLFPITVGANYHMGPASFTINNNQMFFTLTRIPKERKYEKVKGQKDKLTTINVEIYSSSKDANGNWNTPVSFKYNNVNSYSVGDPFITADGQQLYFASNMPGGKGGTDIYVCKRNADGSWGEATNLTGINTAGNERTPNIGEDSFFYFSSDGRIGMGGLDIYKTKLNGIAPSLIQNIGYPINSAQDDFAFTATGRLTGYFSSNREGGLGSDDIYSFNIKEKPIEKPVFTLAGQVLNKETNLPIKEAMVSLSQLNGSLINVTTDETGNFEFKLEEKSDYVLAGEKKGFIKATTLLTTKGLTKSTTFKKDLYLSQIIIGKAIKIENIYYDFDKANIRPDAAFELDKLVTTLKENPNIWIELGSHTDSRGNDAYNLKLSQSRANSAVAYIISKGIAKERVTAKGYGETQLVNQCANGVKCTEEEHQLNRRTEFKITKQ